MRIEVKVLLIDPWGSVVGINAGLAYLSGSLKKEGYQVKVLDFNNYPENQEKRLEKELSQGVDVIGFSVRFNTLMEATRLAEICRRISNDSTIVVGGPGVTVEWNTFLRENQVFDYGFLGEAEYSFPKFLKFLEGKLNIQKIPGLCYKENGEMKITKCEIVTELDKIPFPDFLSFDKFYPEKYSYPLVTSRGCPYNCSYCSVRLVSGSHFRYRSPEHVIMELVQAKEKYGISNFDIVDDTFTQNIDRAKEICKMMITEKLSLTWTCLNGIRADKTDKELFRLMKSACCREVWFGVETLNNEVFKLVNKGERIEDILRAITEAKGAGLRVGAFFIVGLPQSNFKKDMETLKKAKQLGIDTCTWSIATPMPGTTLWEWVKDNAIILDDYRNISFFVEPKVVFDTSDYTKEERLRVFYNGNLAFHRYDCLTSEFQLGKRIMAVLKIVMKYDLSRLPIHIISGFEILLQQFLKKNSKDL